MSVSFRFIYLDLVIIYMNIQNVMPKLVTVSHKYSHEHIRIGKHDARMPNPDKLFGYVLQIIIIIIIMVHLYSPTYPTKVIQGCCTSITLARTFSLLSKFNSPRSIQPCSLLRCNVLIIHLVHLVLPGPHFTAGWTEA